MFHFNSSPPEILVALTKLLVIFDSCELLKTTHLFVSS